MKITDIFELCYCVNLDNRTDRWKLCLPEFEKIGVHPERFSAIYDPVGWKGCRKSHIEILKKAKEEKKNVLIFEDDFEVINHENNLLDNVAEELNKIKWDMFYLGGNILRPFYQVSNHLAKLTHCQSTHAYGVNYNFLDTLIPIVEKNNFIIDVVYADGVIPYHNCYITIPMVAIQRADYSDIEKTVMDYSIPLARYNHFLVRRNYA